MAERRCDILVAGGGLGGVAAALAATARGRSVVLSRADRLARRAAHEPGGPARRAPLDRALRLHPQLPAAAGRDPRALPGAHAADRAGAAAAGAQPGRLHRLAARARAADRAGRAARAARARAGGRAADRAAAPPPGARRRHRRPRRRGDARGARTARSWSRPDRFLDATETGALLPACGAEHVTGSESRERDRRAARRAAGAPGQPAAGQRLLRARPPARARTTRSRRRRATRRRSRGPRPTRGRTAPCRGRLIPNPDEDPYAIGPDFDDPDLDKDLWRFRRIAARGLFEPGAYPSDITLVNWPQIDYTDAPVLDGPDAGARALSLHFLRWMQREHPGLRLRGDVVGDTPDGLAKAPYVREARRIAALRTVVEQDIALDVRGAHGAAEVPDAVGIGHYRIDLHPSTGGDPYLDIPCCPFQLPLSRADPAAAREPDRRRQVPRHHAHHQRRVPPAPGRVERRRGGRPPRRVQRGRRRPAARGRRAAGAARPLPGRAGRRRDRARLAGGDPARE